MLFIAALLLACTNKETEYPDYSNDKQPADSALDSDPGQDSEPQIDEDGDGYGPSTDCDDADPNVHPDAEEICNERDDDCDDEIDEGLEQTWYVDADGDGYGGDETVLACAQPEDSSAQDGDCDDNDDDVNPGAAEDCEDERDLDCDGDSAWADADGDGSAECADCDDNDGDRRPGAAEVCDGIDNDCNGDIDDDADGATSWFADTDGDGYGDGSAKLKACDQPSGYVADASDCDDTEALSNPGETEVCDELDNDCDGDVDEGGLGGPWYVDADADGYGEEGSTALYQCEMPSGYADNEDDCDDTDPDANPGETEVCDGVDNDCSGDVDEDTASDATTWYADVDGDGYGDASISVTQCDQPSNSSSNSDDCDDSDANVSPDATEICDSVDNDCDGTTDGADAADAATWYDDDDGDGYGDPTASTQACTAPTGTVSDDSDCDDTDSSINPDGSETCNSADDDCDGVVDEGASDATVYYLDSDGDGYGEASSSVSSCSTPTGYVSDDSDCDDSDALTYPGATEICDGADNDCDGTTDEGFSSTPSTWYADDDGDGHGDPDDALERCTQPSGYLADDSDCDDTDSSVNPAATEYCDSVDNDCDGTVDEDDAADASTFYADADSDGYGDSGTTTVSCTAPTGYVSDATDCDDASASANPGATEYCDDEDNDCDGSTDEADAADATIWYRDADGDDYGTSSGTTVTACDEPTGYVADSSDCDDTDSSIHPDADELCDSTDWDCDGSTTEGAVDAGTYYDDDDGDGYGDESDATESCSAISGTISTGGDCDDTDSSVNPAATEYCDSVDNDCDGTVDEDDAADASTFYADADGDGYGDSGSTSTSCSAGTGYVSDDTDCDDTDATASPGATEYCDSVDNDCDGSTDEADAADASDWYVDSDSDGFGDDSASATTQCDQPSGYVSDNSDCDDTDDDVNPDADEVCDSTDWDCDGSTTEGAVDAGTYYDDDDGDGYGDESDATESCSAISGTISTGGDCDDTDSSINPAATEYCDSVDNDCDGTVDEDDAADASTWYADTDGDGYGDSASSAVACSAPSGGVADDTDCDDTDGSTYPGAAETCYDGVVNDCGGTEADALAECSLTGDLDADDATWVFEGEGGDEAGRDALIEDVDGDGDYDLVVGAPGASSDDGTVYVLLDPGSATSNSLADADLALTGSSSEELGYALAWWDSDGDGDDDLIIGAPAYASYNNGAIYVAAPLSASSPLGAAIGTTKKWANCGEKLSATGDLDGDGDADLTVSCLGWDSSAGSVLLFTGPLSGVTDLSSSASASLIGDSSSQHAGESVTGADLDGDGQDDWIVGAKGANSNKGAAWVYSGPVSGALGPGDADFDLRGTNTNGYCGQVATLDHNGDGSADLVVGCPGTSSTSGRAFVVNGNLSGTSSLATADASLTTSKETLGTAVGSAGDLDGDGYDDLLVTAPLANAKAGTTYFLYGPLSGGLTATDADATLSGESGTSSGQLAFGDFDGDGDGVNEVIFTGTGATNSDGQGKAGAVYLFSGAQY